MREDQRKRLADLSERLCDRAMIDADPDNWSGGDLLPRDMDRDARGDAVWCRKVALATISLLCRVEGLIEIANGLREPPPDHDPEADIKRAEKMASQALQRIGERGKATH